jgi:uncharacterized membrane protein YbhN (UPF0104 family)
VTGASPVAGAGLPWQRIVRWVALPALALLVAYVVRELDLSRAWAELGPLRARWLVAAAACYFAILPLWAVQWQLLAPIDGARSGRSMFAIVALTSTVLNTTPLLVGEATGIVLLVARGGLSRAAALSVLAMDQLLVGLAKITVLATAALLLTLPQWMSGAVLPLAGGVAALLVLLTVAAWRHSDLSRWAEQRFTPWLGSGVSSVGEALAPLRSPRRGGSALVLAFAKKALEVIAILCIQRAFGISLPVASGVLILACLNLATLLPVVPGNLGVYEAVVVLAYTRLGVPAEQALSVAVVQHLCYFAALALPGCWWVVRGRRVAASQR